MSTRLPAITPESKRLENVALLMTPQLDFIPLEQRFQLTCEVSLQ